MGTQSKSSTPTIKIMFARVVSNSLRTQSKNKQFLTSFQKFQTKNSFKKSYLNHHFSTKVLESGPNSVVLPLKSGKTFFSFNQNDSLKTLLNLIKEEDQSADLKVLTKEGYNVSQNSKLSVAFSQPTRVVLNGEEYDLPAIHDSTPSTVAAAPVGNTVTSPPAASSNTSGVVLPSTDAATQQVIDEVIQLRAEIDPMQQKKEEVDELAEQRASRIVWVGAVALMSQWLFLARLTWYDLNWDIMEPVTYFITTGNAIVMYIWFALNRTEYTYDSWFDKLRRRRADRLYRKMNFDIDRYDALCDRMDDLEASLPPVARLQLKEAQFKVGQD